MSDQLLLDKKSLRAECAALRQSIDPARAKQASHQLADQLLMLITRPGVVAGYRATRGEIDLSETLSRLATRGHTLCLPVVESMLLPLYFRRWEMDQALEKGKYDIDVPPASEPHVMPDIVIVPLLGFDASGHRLGYGAGYYDRTIRALHQSTKNIQIIGAAFAAQQIDSIPADAHDEKLDAVATEKGVIHFS